MRRLIAALSASAVLAQPLAAQERQTVQELEDLIPDSAIDNPEEWARQGVPPEAAAAEDAQGELEPGDPMTEMPLVDVPWPDQLVLPPIEPLPPEEDIIFADIGEPVRTLPQGSEQRISSELVLVFHSEEPFPEQQEFVQRFRQLSTVEEYDDDDNAARLAAQAREDEELLQRMLRIYGYYDGQVMRTVGGGPDSEVAPGAGAEVRFDIIPGQQYRIGAIDLGALETAGSDYQMLRNAFEVQVGDPVLSDKIVEEQADLDLALGESGYPFAEIDEPDLLIDHDRQEGDLTMPVRPGGKYRFGQITSNMPDFMSGEHLQRIARFEPGDLYQRSLELDLRQAIQATGIVGSTTLTVTEATPPVGEEPGTVDVAVEMTPARLRTLAGRAGYGTGEGFKLEGSWEHRNLFPPEGALRVRAIAGTREQLAGVTFRRNNFRGRDQVLTIDAFASTLDYEAYDAQTASLVATFERVSTLLFQKPFSWSIGLEAVATGEREADAEGNFGPRQTYFIGAIPGYAQWDTSDDLLNPTRGFRLGTRLSPEISVTNGEQHVYLRGQLDASYYLRTSERMVLAARARFASIPGAPLSAIAPSRRLYAGGANSVRGYGYRAIGPQTSGGDPTGGRSLAEVSVEARIQTGFLDGAIQVVPFIDAGTVGSETTPDFDEIKIGAGVGVRYLTGFGPLRVDVGVPLNRGPNDGPVAVYIGLGQAF